MITAYFSLFVVALVVFNAVLAYRKKRNAKYTLPKNPPGVPLLGNILSLVKDPHLKLSEWAQQYGSVYTVFAGSKPILILSDVSSMKEMFNQQASTGKFKNDTMLLLSRGPYGILNTEGAVWAEQRQFCLKNLVHFGFGNKRLEPLILLECQTLIEVIKRKSNSVQDDSGIEIYDCLKCATNNTLMTLVSGERLSLEDQKITEIISEFTGCLQRTMRTGLGFLPWLKRIAPVASGYVGLDNASKRLHNYIEGFFERFSKDIVPHSPRHLIDAYLDKMTTTDNTSSFFGKTGRTNSIASVVELLEAGAETTSATVTWLIYYMTLYPDVQRKLHEELDRVLGENGRDPSLTDKSRLPYTEAVMLECMRKSAPAPIGVIHQLLEDMKFQEYYLPKGMLLIANIYHCHHDRSIWKDPENFKPERFLENGNGQEIDQNLREFVVPFLIGRWSCLGAPLAKDVIFLFVTKLIQAFEVKPVPGLSTDYYFDADMGLGMLPKPRRLLMKYRKQ